MIGVQCPQDHVDQTYQEFMATRKELISITDGVTLASKDLALSQETRLNIERVRNIVENDAFRVIVVGSFSRGKSTMINAIIGEDLLPAKLAPATAVITIIKYGDPSRALVHYKDKMRHVAELPVRDVKDYLLIPREKLDDSSETGDFSTPFERVEILLPCDICKDGVEIVDSPGLEEDEARQRITTEFLTQSDAAIVLLSCQQLITNEEERFIRQELMRRGFDHIFYVINFCDELTSDEDYEDIRHRAYAKLGSEERIFMVSSREALRAKKAQDVHRLRSSGFFEFEKALESFLVSDRGRLKVTTSCKLIRAAVEQLRDAAKVKRGLLERRSADDFSRLQGEFDINHQQILEKKEDVLAKIGDRGALLGERLCSSFARKCRELGEDLPKVANDLEIDGDMFHLKQYQKKTVAALDSYVKDQFKQWAESEAAEIFQTEIERVKQSIDRDIQGILDGIDALKLMLDPDYKPTLQMGDNSFERIAAAVGSLAVGDIGGAITGGVLGARAAIAQVGATIAIQSVLYLVGLLNPVTALITVVGMTAYSLKYGAARRMADVRSDIAGQMGIEIGKLPEATDHVIRERVFEVINGLASVIHQGVLAMLGDLDQQLKSAQRDIEQGSAVALNSLTKVESKLHSLSCRVGAIAERWGGAP